MHQKVWSTITTHQKTEFNRECLVGHIDGCAEKPSNIEIPVESYEYAPTAGIKQLRAAVANLYNEIYRQDKSSKYTYENVSVCTVE